MSGRALAFAAFVLAIQLSPGVSGDPWANPTAYGALEVFADPAAIWGEGIEAEMGRAYSACFGAYLVDGKIMTLRMPFAQYFERQELAGTELVIDGDGKADRVFLWKRVDVILRSTDGVR